VAIAGAMACFFCTIFQILGSLTVDPYVDKTQLIWFGTSFFLGGIVMLIVAAILWTTKRTADEQSK